jgi:hypothetical protein
MNFIVLALLSFTVERRENVRKVVYTVGPLPEDGKSDNSVVASIRFLHRLHISHISRLARLAALKPVT